MYFRTLRVGDTIMIGEDVEVTLLEIDRGKVRLGLTAPRSVPILRLEILMREFFAKRQTPGSAQHG
jgi:carbon storage regulator